MSSPEIVLGASLLTLFLSMSAPLGFGTILIAHVMFSISYVVVTVKARLIGFDRHLEEAAMDLGANEWIDLPQGDAAADRPRRSSPPALLVFALSVDDFVITNFNAGTTVTFPLFVWGAARVGAPAAGERDRLGDLRRRGRGDARERDLSDPPPPRPRNPPERSTGDGRQHQPRDRPHPRPRADRARERAAERAHGRPRARCTSARGRTLAGGVASSYQLRDPWPIYLEHGEGERVWDVDGNEYVDFHNGFGSMTQGHAHPAITRPIARAGRARARTSPRRPRTGSPSPRSWPGGSGCRSGGTRTPARRRRWTRSGSRAG